MFLEFSVYFLRVVVFCYKTKPGYYNKRNLQSSILYEYRHKNPPQDSQADLATFKMSYIPWPIGIYLRSPQQF